MTDNEEITRLLVWMASRRDVLEREGIHADALRALRPVYRPRAGDVVYPVSMIREALGYPRWHGGPWGQIGRAMRALGLRYRQMKVLGRPRMCWVR